MAQAQQAALPIESIAPVQCLQDALAYFALVICDACKMLMKSAPG
jgi:hypothetical protein